MILSLIRFIAGIIVILFHWEEGSLVLQSAPSVFTAGPQMVTFFFVLSGFVLMITYGERKTISVRRYIRKRIKRIFPIYALALLLSTAINYLSGDINVKGSVLNLLFLQSWLPPYPLSVNGPGWFLSDLMSFYMLFPLILISIRKLAVSAKVFLVVSVITWVITQIVLTALFNSPFYQGFPSISHDLIFYFPLSHICSFLIGMSGGYLVMADTEPKSQASRATMFGILSILVTILFIENQDAVNKTLSINIPYGSSFYAPFFLLVIASLYLGPDKDESRQISKSISVLGEMSYPMYIMQSPIYEITSHLLEKRDFSHDLKLLLYLGFLSFISYFVLMLQRRFERVASGGNSVTEPW